MKKGLLGLIFAFGFLCAGEEREIRQSFDDMKPKETMRELLDVVGMPKNLSNILEINEWAQKNLLRQGERWEEQTLQFEGLKDQIQPLVKELGFVDEVTPCFKNYEGAIVPGAFLQRVRLRLAYLVQSWKKGVRFKCLYFLAGERPLDKNLENEAAFKTESSLGIRKDWKEPEEWPRTEYEMSKLVWDQADLPKDFREVEVHFFNAPMKEKNGKLVRPTTDDTIEDWVKSHPIEGPYLVVTNQPYIPRQDAVFKRLVPKQYIIETIGEGLGANEKMAIILDEVGRFIYEAKNSQQG